jgi:hypothetical protein
MQMGLIFYLWILLRSFRLFRLLISFCVGKKQSHKRTTPIAQTEGNIIPRIRHWFTEHDRIIRIVLVEFQEAQCFFMIASQAAILLAKKIKHRLRIQHYAFPLGKQWHRRDSFQRGCFPDCYGSVESPKDALDRALDFCLVCCNCHHV